MIASITVPPHTLIGLDEMRGIVQDVWRNERVAYLETRVLARVEGEMSALPAGVRRASLAQYRHAKHTSAEEGALNRSAIITYAVRYFNEHFADYSEAQLRAFKARYVNPPDGERVRHLVSLSKEVTDTIETLAQRLHPVFGDNYPLHWGGSINRRFVIHLALEAAALPESDD